MNNVITYTLPQIIHKYNTFLVDLWGVVYDGINIYSYINQTMAYLRQHKKQVIFLSNSPRPSHITIARLIKCGLILKDEKIVTSGDYFIHETKTPTLFDMHRKKAFVLGLEVNDDLMKATNIVIVDNIKQADFIVILTFLQNQTQWLQYKAVLELAASYDLPALIPNPDITAPHGNKIRYIAGYLAQKYEKMGGNCFYYGKPYTGIYKYIFDKFALDKRATIAVGDNLNTDIRGANFFGIDSLLVLSGVHKHTKDLNKYKPKYELPRFAVY